MRKIEEKKKVMNEKTPWKTNIQEGLRILYKKKEKTKNKRNIYNLKGFILLYINEQSTENVPVLPN